MPQRVPDGMPNRSSERFGEPHHGAEAARMPAPDDGRGVIASAPFDTELARWSAAARAEDAAGARARERWLRQAATEEASMAGVLTDLAERCLPVVVQTVAGRCHTGVVTAVGRDFCVVSVASGRQVLVALSALAAVRPEGGAAVPVGDRVLAPGLELGEALFALAGERPHAHVVTAAGDGIRGEVRSVGRDVLTFRLDGADRRTVYVPLAAVTEVALT